MKKIKPFGHLMTVDLYGCRKGVCDNLDLCYQFMEDIVNKLKMKKQSPPFIFRSDNEIYPDKAGLSGLVPLIESGVQIHTLIPKNFISIDVYSCKKFSTKDIEEFTKNYFSAKEVEVNFVERGVKYNTVT